MSLDVGPRKIGVVGTLVWDTNWHPAVLASGAPLEQWGGAVYSLTALSASRPPGWIVEPVIKVGADLDAQARLELAGFPGVIPGMGLKTVPEPNNRVELRYRDASYRDEILSGGVPPWSFAELEPIVRQHDALYVNFLSGAEMALETALALRSALSGPIYADLHSLFLAPPSAGPRRPRPLPDWRVWVSCFDVVQLNETELGLIAGRGSCDEVLGEILRHGPAIVIVTLGGAGVRYAISADAPARLPWSGDAMLAPRSGHVAPPFGALEGDPTGCGDVCGAAFFAGLLAGLPVEDALGRAQILAAVKMLHPDTTTLREAFVRALTAGEW
jgi:sugar/nucleoside kinase (ribokinase family)